MTGRGGGKAVGSDGGGAGIIDLDILSLLNAGLTALGGLIGTPSILQRCCCWVGGGRALA